MESFTLAWAGNKVPSVILFKFTLLVIRGAIAIYMWTAMYPCDPAVSVWGFNSLRTKCISHRHHTS